jgi:signal transduction histidine kinase
VEERERRRIAENLHDSLGQTLGLAFMNLSSIDVDQCPPQIKNTIKFTSKQLNKSNDESRKQTYDLSPPILYELGLIPAIKWKLEQFEKEHKIKTSLEFDSDKDHPTKDYKIFLYRIVGELLTNIKKHANASEVKVKLYIKDEQFFITVEDDGVGIDKSSKKPAPNSGGFGLLSITERIESMNGTFKIEAAGNGTVAEIEVPLNN